MNLVEITRHPTNRQLQQFGVICLLMLPFVGWLWSGSQSLLIWLAGIGSVIAVLSFLYPGAIKPLFVSLMLITAPIGMLIGEIAMFLIYSIVFLPIGLCFRIVSRDRLRLQQDPESATYWQRKQRPKSVASYYRQS